MNPGCVVVHVRSRTGRVKYYIDPAQLLERRVCVSGNEANVAEFFGAWIALVSDSPLRLQKDGKRFLYDRRVYNSFLRLLLSQTVQSTVLCYADLADKLMKGCELYGVGSSTGPFLEEMKETPVFPVYLDWWRSGDPALLTYLLSFLLFGKKLDYDDEEFATTAFRSWEKVEERISKVELPSFTRDIALILDYVLPVVPPHKIFLGHHSTGSTADGKRRISEKNLYLGLDPLLSRSVAWPDEAMSEASQFFRYYEEGYPLKRGTPIVVTTDTHDDKSKDPILSPITGKPLRLPSEKKPLRSMKIRRASKVRFVAKNLKTYRSICMEPTSYMYLQQHARLQLQSAIEEGPLGRFITLKRQETNQEAALIGSYTGELDTIDLSAASDSVTMRLVRDIFRTRWVRHALLSTRTHVVKCPDGSVRTVEKFAPMGSAVCFPVQCIIFSAVCIYASIIYSEKNGGDSIRSVLLDRGALMKFLRERMHLSNERVFTPKLLPFCVYGDDICCDSRVTATVIQLLNALGFDVNNEKSFTGSKAFRESCGKFYYSGHDVTPLLYRVKRSEPGKEAKSVASLIDFTNRVGDYGYANCHRFLVRRIIGDTVDGGRGLAVAFSNNRDQSGCLFSTSVRNDHLKRRHSAALQRDEVRAIFSKARIEPGSYYYTWKSEIVRYWRWWTAAYQRGKSHETNGVYTTQYIDDTGTTYLDVRVVEDTIVIPLDESSGTRLCWRWTPA